MRHLADFEVLRNFLCSTQCIPATHVEYRTTAAATRCAVPRRSPESAAMLSPLRPALASGRCKPILLCSLHLHRWVDICANEA